MPLLSLKNRQGKENQKTIYLFFSTSSAMPRRTLSAGDHIKIAALIQKGSQQKRFESVAEVPADTFNSLKT